MIGADAFDAPRASGSRAVPHAVPAAGASRRARFARSVLADRASRWRGPCCPVWRRHEMQGDLNDFELERRALPRHCSATAITLDSVMSKKVVCARPDLEVRAVIRLMLDHHIG